MRSMEEGMGESQGGLVLRKFWLGRAACGFKGRSSCVPLDEGPRTSGTWRITSQSLGWELDPRSYFLEQRAHKDVCSVCLRLCTWFGNLYVKMTQISRQQYPVLTEGAKQQSFGVKILRKHDLQVRTQTVGPYITSEKCLLLAALTL